MVRWSFAASDPVRRVPDRTGSGGSGGPTAPPYRQAAIGGIAQLIGGIAQLIGGIAQLLAEEQSVVGPAAEVVAPVDGQVLAGDPT